MLDIGINLIPISISDITIFEQVFLANRECQCLSTGNRTQEAGNRKVDTDMNKEQRTKSIFVKKFSYRISDCLDIRFVQ